MSGEETKPPLTVSEAGRRGGKATLAKRGRAFYAAIGAKGGAATQRRNAALAKAAAKAESALEAARGL